jgi:Fe-S-cluster containining protein
MDCRIGCGACCIAPSISSPIPGHPAGKPAGVRCAQLSINNRCLIYDDPRRPAVCIRFQASPETCGTSRAEALRLLARLELETAPEQDNR